MTTKQDTRAAVLLQLIKVLEAEKDVHSINKRFNNTIGRNGSLDSAIKECGKEYDVESLIVGAIIGTTAYMLADQGNVQKASNTTSDDPSYMFG